ncbi:MAG: NACHT domain-containing protein [Prosthecobacter sp.]|uniref:NACHT domain-containing protein n=1 Tax=Prosthecobacter sp. TaxID=1965333 RepID=UPI003BB1749C
MSTTLMALGLYKSAQISLPLLKAGFKILRDNVLSSGTESEWEKGVQGFLGEQVKELLKGRIDKLSPKQLEAVEAPLVAFTGLVLQSLMQDVLNTEDFASVKVEFTTALDELPQRWKTFVGQGIPEAQPLNNTDFLAALQAAHDGDDSSPAISPEWLSAFFSQWIQRGIGLTPQREGWHTKLAAAVAPLVTEALSSTLVAEHPVAAAAFRDSMLRFHTELRSLVKEVITEVKNQGAQSAERDNKLAEVIFELAANQQISNKESRLAAYKRSLLSAFRPYQELAIDNFAAGEQAAPDIWEIFIHPACSTDHLRPEDMDAAQRETPPRLPAQDLLPLLTQDDYRRTVLLADPGMGKSTLIQSLIAHLASERPLSGAPSLTGMLPIPLILRDLVPLLPQDQVESWSWDSLLTILVEHYQRDETAPPLCDGFKDHRNEFRQIIHTDEAVFFLIDGLDEIGDLAKRRQIVKCIQDGIRAANKAARWLITSRVIGYEDARVDWVEAPEKLKWASAAPNGVIKLSKWIQLNPSYATWTSVWHDYVLKFGDKLSIGELSEFVVDDTEQEEAQLLSSDDRSLLNEGRIRHRVLSALPIAQRLHLAPFDDKRQNLFTERWFQHRHSTDYSRELMREVRAHHHDGVRIISRVPNLLCMMNILKRSGKPLPDGRAALYDAIVQAYLGGIDAAYRLRPVLGNTCPFDTAQRRFLLSLLGAHMQQIRSAYMQSTPEIEEIEEAETEPELEGGSFGADGNILISRPELEQLLDPAIQRMREEGWLVSTHTTAELLDELLHHIASRSGLLIPRSSDAEGNTHYGFTHLSFLEFFAAGWLGMEFDRLRNRNSRRKEADDDEQCITEADLDREFPPHGPIQHTRESFRDLPAMPTWHESLIFLLESRKADTPTLLRWLFPALHSHQPHVVSKEHPTPLLPLNAVHFAVDLAQDPEIPLPAAARLKWWHILWSASLQWPYTPWHDGYSERWHVAPLLLSNSIHREESLNSLISIDQQHPNSTLYLNFCDNLTDSDLSILTQMRGLRSLDLEGCVGIKNLPDMQNMKSLKHLSLWGCNGLKTVESLDGLKELTGLEGLQLSACMNLTQIPDLRKLTSLKKLFLWRCPGLHKQNSFQNLSLLSGLETLNLSYCIGFEDTMILANLKNLKSLYLRNCNGLNGREALRGLIGLKALEVIDLTGCTALRSEDVVWLKKERKDNCTIYWKSMPRVGPTMDF